MLENKLSVSYFYLSPNSFSFPLFILDTRLYLFITDYAITLPVVLPVRLHLTCCKIPSVSTDRRQSMRIYLLTLCSFIPSVLLFETEVGYLFYFDSLVICINLSCSVSDFIRYLHQISVLLFETECI